MGAKVISLSYKPDAHESLWLQPARPLQLPPYDAVFTDYDISGWDECFPTIYPVEYPEEPWRGTEVPDYGEAWTLLWHWSFTNDVLCMWTHSVRFGYRFERSLMLLGSTFAISYLVDNHTSFALNVVVHAPVSPGNAPNQSPATAGHWGAR